MNPPVAQNHRLIALGSEFDLRSLIVPCYYFEDRQLSLEYAEAEIERRNAYYLANPHSAGVTFASFNRSRQYWVPRDAQLSRDSHRLMANGQKDKSIWIILRARSYPMPQGATNAILLTEGRRLFRLPYIEQPDGAPKWWQRLATGGGRHCFAKWGRQRDGSPLTKVAMGGVNHTFIYSAKAARCVLYARTTTFDFNGQVNGCRIEIVFVEVHIVDSDPNKDDMMNVKISSRVCVNSDPDLSDLNPIWDPLVEDAKTGFNLHCWTTPQRLRRWREFFLKQKNRAEAERDNFMRDIKAEGMDYKKALDLVQEPWQLQLVIEAYCDCNSSFNEHPSDSTDDRVRRMLDAYDCAPERRDLLEDMINDYVAIADEKWVYAAD